MLKYCVLSAWNKLKDAIIVVKYYPSNSSKVPKCHFRNTVCVALMELPGQHQSSRLASLSMFLIVQISSKVPLGNPTLDMSCTTFWKLFIVLHRFPGASAPLLVRGSGGKPSAPMRTQKQDLKKQIQTQRFCVVMPPPSNTGGTRLFALNTPRCTD